MTETKKMPRKLSDGLWWLGDCLETIYRGKTLHGYNAAYLVIGEDSTLLVETGHPKDFPVIVRHIEEILSTGVPPLRHLFVTHQETPHSGGMSQILDKYPDITVHGDVSDYHMAFPQHADRMRPMQIGDSIDLGGRNFVLVEPVIRDMRSTMWGFDTGEHALFPGDGFAYTHYHWDGHCGSIAEEAVSLDLREVAGIFAERALFWTNFAEMDVYIDRLQALLADLDVRIIGPSHGLPIMDPENTVPKVIEGFLAGTDLVIEPEPEPVD